MASSNRKRSFTRRELLEDFRECNKSAAWLAQKVCQELLPDGHDPETSEEIKKLSETVDVIRRKLLKLRVQDKRRHFRHEEEKLDEKFISASQHSIFKSSQGTNSSQESFISDPSSSLDRFSQEVKGALPTTRQKRPITDPSLGSEARRRRVEDKRLVFQKWCEQEQCSPLELAGLFIYLEYYMKTRTTAKIGWALFTGGECSPIIPQKATTEEAIWMIERCGLSQTNYTDLRLLLLDRFILPPVYLVMRRAQLMDPKLIEYKKGVYAELSEALSLTIVEHLSLLEPSKLTPTISFSFNYGLDGSGKHADYDQSSKGDQSTKNVISACFALTSIVNSNGIVLWSSDMRGHNSPTNTRQWFLFPEKESDRLLKQLIPVLESQVKQVKKHGLELTLHSGWKVQATVSKANMSMIDGKMVTRLLQIGGAYCTMCHLSQNECHDLSQIAMGFKISRTLDSLHQLALNLLDPETEEIPKSSGDYATRQGLTARPIVTVSDVTNTLPVCHSKIQTIDWVLNRLLPKQNSHKKWHSPSTPVRYTAEEKDEEKQERELIKAAVKSELSIDIGDPSNMLTGNKFKMFSEDQARVKISSMIRDPTVREAFEEIHIGLCAIVLVINSQKRKVNISRYTNLCQSVYSLLCSTFPWAIISPSLHRVLAHSYELIELNGMKGLGNLSEEGLEGNNKFIRHLRQHGARKTSTEANFHDVFKHLWRKSSPLLAHLDREKKKRGTKTVIKTEINSLIESLYEEEDLSCT